MAVGVTFREILKIFERFLDEQFPFLAEETERASAEMQGALSGRDDTYFFAAFKKRYSGGEAAETSSYYDIFEFHCAVVLEFFEPSSSRPQTPS